jgi:hypothetical protein
MKIAQDYVQWQQPLILAALNLWVLVPDSIKQVKSSFPSVMVKCTIHTVLYGFVTWEI